MAWLPSGDAASLGCGRIKINWLANKALIWSTDICLGRLPTTVIADASYRNEENHAYLEQSCDEGYAKYLLLAKQQKYSWRKQRFQVENWQYNPARDIYICPTGQSLIY